MIGTSLLELIRMTREEAGLSTNVGVNVDDTPRITRAINRVYSLLLKNYDWPHLKIDPVRIPLQAGEVLYDFPAEIDLQGIKCEIVSWIGLTFYELERGITPGDISAYGVSEDMRSDPATKWDLAFDGNATQIKIWPRPASNSQELELRGRRKTPRLIADEDRCWLDDDLVATGAAVRLLARDKSPEAELVRADHLDLLAATLKSNGPSEKIIMGGGGDPKKKSYTLAVARTK